MHSVFKIKCVKYVWTYIYRLNKIRNYIPCNTWQPAVHLVDSTAQYARRNWPNHQPSNVFTFLQNVHWWHEADNRRIPNWYKCPICRELTLTQDCAEMDFVSQLIDDDGKEKVESKLCDKCQNKPLIKRCLDCRVNFYNSHNSWSALKNHKWVDLTDVTNKMIDHVVNCSDHAGETIKLHCKQC